MSHPAVLIEHMEVVDLPEVLAIERQSFDDPWGEETFRSELRHCWSECRVLRREDDRKLLGYLVFWRVVDEMHLLNVAVEPGERHHHYGTMLLEHLLEFGRDGGARFVSLEVRTSNTAGLALYEGVGFERVGVRPQYYSDSGEDAIVMLYDLSRSGGGAAPREAASPDV